MIFISWLSDWFSGTHAVARRIEAATAAMQTACRAEVARLTKFAVDHDLPVDLPVIYDEAMLNVTREFVRDHFTK